MSEDTFKDFVGAVRVGDKFRKFLHNREQELYVATGNPNVLINGKPVATATSQVRDENGNIYTIDTNNKTPVLSDNKNIAKKGDSADGMMLDTDNETVLLNPTSLGLTSAYEIYLRWEGNNYVDLDLHAFYEGIDGEGMPVTSHVYWRQQSDYIYFEDGAKRIWLNYDFIDHEPYDAKQTQPEIITVEKIPNGLLSIVVHAFDTVNQGSENERQPYYFSEDIVVEVRSRGKLLREFSISESYFPPTAEWNGRYWEQLDVDKRAKVWVCDIDLETGFIVNRMTTWQGKILG